MKLNLKAPHQRYHTADGLPAPGVTTITGEMDKPFLRPWTGREERSGILRFMGEKAWTAAELEAALPVTKDGKPALFADAKREKAADLGTVAHARILGDLSGDPLERDGLGDLYDDAEPAYNRFFEWVGATETMLAVQTEHKMVSERWRVGGTADLLFSRKVNELWDIKTGKPWFSGAPYREQFAQVAAYAAMYEETTGHAIERIVIARVGKSKGDSGDFYPVSAEERAAGLDIFLSALGVYRGTKALERGRK